ncbi:MAG: hypothetical protein GVY16_02465 [Planctomycetes bacterium]|nr:hypothetical protein [Phycisphaerae bacterium]NBB94581.1 hypothetical protein [Planctomycetota bacterium]
MTRRKKMLLYVGGAILLLVVWVVGQASWFYSRDEIVISRQTTFVTDPIMNADGTVNYLAWLNRRRIGRLPG